MCSNYFENLNKLWRIYMIENERKWLTMIEIVIYLNKSEKRWYCVSARAIWTHFRDFKRETVSHRGRTDRKLNTSESTIRRDLTELNRQGLLIKVHGGATAIKSVLSREEEVITKSKKHQEEKRKIAKYAASLINKEDIVYLDAGTTTEMMLDYLREYDVIYVTNGITHARKLMNAGFKVHLIGGEIKR